MLRDFEALLIWSQRQGAVDDERAAGIRRRAVLQPAAAAATLVDARRVRAALRVLAEKGQVTERVREDAVVEINVDNKIEASYRLKGGGAPEVLGSNSGAAPATPPDAPIPRR